MRRKLTLKGLFGSSWKEVEYRDIATKLQSMPLGDIPNAKEVLDLAIGKRYWSASEAKGQVKRTIIVQVVLVLVIGVAVMGWLATSWLGMYCLILAAFQVQRYLRTEYLDADRAPRRALVVPSIAAMCTTPFVYFQVGTLFEIRTSLETTLLAFFGIFYAFVFSSIIELILIYPIRRKLRQSFVSMWDEIADDYPDVVALLPVDYQETEYLRF